MYYYAFIDENNFVQQIYAFPTTITHPQYILISSNDTTLVGKYYDRATGNFKSVYYYAVINDRNVVTTVDFSYDPIIDSTYIAITGYDESIIGLYWNGAAFVTPPINVIAVASSDTINYKSQNKWLSEKLDDMDAATVGKADASHTHSASDLSGVVKSINNTAPDENGNVTVASSGGSGMTAAEMLDMIKSVDGIGSGLDADRLDGLEATSFAAASHTHDGYATPESIAALEEEIADKADAIHVHTIENVTGLVTALAGKSEIDHSHNTAYAAISHAHSIENVNGLATALDGKANASHTHTGYATTESVITGLSGKANTSHTHAQNDVTGLSTALGGKANTTHTHSQSDITGLTSALIGKSSTSHTHSNYLSNSGGTVNGDVNVAGIFRVNGNQAYYHNASSNTITIGTNNAAGMVLATGGNLAVNAGALQTYNIVPRNTSSYLGGSNTRWHTIYAQNSLNVSSDERLKKNIKKCDAECLAKFISELDVIEYKYLNESDTESKHIGITAQQCLNACQSISEYFVCCDENGYYSLKPADLVFPLIAAVQQLSKEVARLKK